jgi:C4-dicarboxylate-specific signal transduction histidine kinase
MPQQVCVELKGGCMADKISGRVSQGSWPEEVVPGFERMSGIFAEVLGYREEALRENEELYRMVLDSLKIHIAVVDRDGNIVTVNKQWNSFGRGIGGISPATMAVGANYLEACRQAWMQGNETVRQALAGLQAVIDASRQAFEMEYECRSPETSSSVWYRMSAIRLPQQRGIVVSHLDITERKRAEEALHKAQTELAHVSRVTLMGELAASIAHEINQPLTAVITNADLCLDWVQCADPDWNQIREILEDVVRDARRVSDVSGGIRALLRKSVPAKAPLSINEAISEVCALVRSEVTLKRVELRVELATNLPLVMGDKVRLQQVLLNLIKNGIDAVAPTKEGSRELLIRSARQAPDELLVTVRDSGVGLGPEELERAFEPFFTTKKQGLGMGLSISRTIVHDHQGRMWAAPNLDGGLTLCFTLPAYREETS